MDKDRIVGAAHQVKGVVKETVGKVTGDAKTQAEGAAEKAAGKGQLYDDHVVYLLSREGGQFQYREVKMPKETHMRAPSVTKTPQRRTYRRRASWEGRTR
jgi:uncharacterized protein YjbJ (UPF0337 family)